MNTAHQKEKYLKTFLIGFGIMLLIYIPFLLIDKGLFVYYGDYNVQQIPFYQLCHNAVRNGNIFWNWQTDLGTNFIGSYAFYTLGSPFFWLTLPFPNAWLPYLMPLLTCLKYGLATLFAYAYIRRFVKRADNALIGALLYAFSGFSAYNIFFNHFHEAIVFFPLLLIALEETVVNNRKGVFALSVALCAFISYYFFAGQAVFLVIYFIIRLTCKDFKLSFSKFISLALETVIGIGIAAAILYPSVLMVLGNPRIEADSVLTGWNMIFYDRIQRYGTIIQSFFFPPDIPARPNFFPENGSKWASVAGYLPFFSMAGVITFFSKEKKHFVKRIITVCIIFAFIPFLNSAFQLFNGCYYARWFYMPVLFMAMATAITIDRHGFDMKAGFVPTVLITAAFSLIGILPSIEKADAAAEGDSAQNTSTLVFGKLPASSMKFWITVAVTAISLICLGILIKKRKSKRAFGLALLFTCVFSVLTSGVMMTFGRIHGPEPGEIQDKFLNSSFELDESEFFRIDYYNEMDNASMFWGYSAIQSFQSIIPSSMFDFYSSIGVERSVGTRPDYAHIGLRGLTSTKYLFVSADKYKEDYEYVPGFEYHSNQNGFVILENKYFVPMGYSYESYVTKDQGKAIDENKIDRLYCKALYLTDEQIEKYSAYLEPAERINNSVLTEEEYLADCERLRSTAAQSFSYDKYGFSAAVNSDKANLYVFSVPYDEGWIASVNGVPTQIEKVNNGFMAVLVPKGTSEIRFTYRTPGLKAGLLISAVSVGAFVIYMLIWLVLIKIKPAKFGKKRYAHLYGMDIIEKPYIQEELANQLLEGLMAEPLPESEEEPQEDSLPFRTIQDIASEHSAVKENQTEFDPSQFNIIEDKLNPKEKDEPALAEESPEISMLLQNEESEPENADKDAKRQDEASGLSAELMEALKKLGGEITDDDFEEE